MPRKQKAEIAIYLGRKWLITLVSGLDHGIRFSVEKV